MQYKHKGFVYFVRRCDDIGPIKIGFSCLLKERLARLMVWSPYPLKVLATIEGTLATEREMHRRFDKYWLRHEWFEPASELLEFIETLDGAYTPVEKSASAAERAARQSTLMKARWADSNWRSKWGAQ